MTSTGDAPPAPTRATRSRPHPLDAIAVALAVAGAGCVGTGLLPGPDAAAVLGRVLPLLLFLGTVVVLAELTAAAGVFDVLATRLAVAARGSWPGLFALCVGFAATTTIALNLDTTAVLLTPVLLTLAVTLRTPVAPLAVTTVWLANTASLMLPVSNLTNLLAADRIGLDPLAYAEVMWLPQLAVLAVTTILLWYCWWRRDRPAGGRFPAPAVHRPADPVLYRTALAACLLFVGAILAGAPVGLASAIAAGLLVLGFAIRSPGTLRPALLPWRLLLFVTGLFLVVQTIGQHGLNDLVAWLAGHDGGVLGVLRAGATGALLANLVNNLPAYLAGEAVLPVDDRQRLLALLVGTNVGPLALPWASLATLLWLERCRAARVQVPVARFLVTSAAVAVLGTLAGVGALLLTG
ncbi:arsenical pump membrane protein [Micromonospora phaseoli]|uniref:Arsenical pump membrane protein n=1 Tax=Micromonospora phaseoli TaxID=1144548 RepID=A0A1H6YRJ1_9ACTN|nr:SLC13 family permease [Micromonospora phaseoli]PZW00359.1 arsenite efflux membrane protein ArsB [Micromonospora phaseoli]GIJ76837.1 arsenic transporter [Micromonospora phaseoli]SEJ43903.1 arsenical pump membrane protein [Micromonospora phaseoli]